MANAPRDVNGFFAFLTVPPGDPFPAELHLRKVCGVVWSCTGDLEQAEEALRPAREFGPPLLDGVAPTPFPGLQSAFDEVYPPGLQWYWKADFVNSLPDEAIAAHAEYGAQMPSMHSTMHLYPIDGAVHDVAQDETAFSLSRFALGGGDRGRRSRAGERRRSLTGPSSIGRRCTRIRPAARTSTSS